MSSQTIKLLSLYWGYSLGGVGKYAVLLDASKRCVPVEIQHVCIRGRNWPTDEQTLQALSARTIWINTRTDFSWIQELRREISKCNPDLIMTHGYNGHFVMQTMLVLGYYHGPLVCSYHGLYHPTTTLRKFIAPVFNRFSEWYISRCLSAIAVAEYSRRYLIGRGVESKCVEVIHNGIEDKKVPAASRWALRREWGIVDGGFVIGVASRLDPVKGVDYLVSAFGRLAEKHKQIVLVLAGSGTEEVALRAQVEHAELSNAVKFLGFRSDVAECLDAFDIFVLPSLAEYHSIGLLEAMRAGKSIVVTDVGGNTESVCNMKEALVVPAADTEELETALSRLLSDHSLRERLGTAARERYLAEFTKDVMLEQTGKWLLRCAEYTRQYRK